MSDFDMSRRSFFVLIGGAALGMFTLPGGGAETAPRRLLSKPLRKRQAGRIFVATGEPAFFLLWVELDADEQPRTMIWTPETRDEIAEANRFYETARTLQPGPALDMPPLDPREETLAEAYLDEPDDVDARLAYAAFLHEKGSSQGEFVAINHRLETLPPDDPDREALDDRWSELLTRDAETWLAPLASLGLRPEVFGTCYPGFWLAETGLVEEIDLEQPGILPERAEELKRAAPVLHRLRIEYDDVNLTALAACPFLSRLTALGLSSLSLTPEAVRPLLASPYLIRLRRLDLGYNDLGPDFGAMLARAEILPRLRELEIPAIDLGNAGAVALFTAWTDGQLTHLNVAGNQLDAVGLTALATCPALRGLRRLLLAENVLDAAGLHALASAPFLATLTDLDLSRCSIDAATLTGLVTLPLPNLARLKLNGNRFGAAGAKILAGAHWPRLVHLDLEACELGDAGLTALGAGSLLTGLEELGLRENRLGPRGVEALANGPWAARLRVLNLGQNRCGEDGANAVAASEHLARLHKLIVTAKSLGPTGKAVLLGRFGPEVVQIDDE